MLCGAGPGGCPIGERRRAPVLPECSRVITPTCQPFICLPKRPRRRSRPSASAMVDFHCLHGECPPIPDDVTVAQFILDSYHPTRPLRDQGKPWLIDDATGRHVGYEEVRNSLFPSLAEHESGLSFQLRTRTHGLANALHMRWGIGAWHYTRFRHANDCAFRRG